MTTDTDALTERLWEAVAEVRDQHPRVFNDAPTDDVVAAVLPLVAEEVRKAAKEARDQCAEEQATWPRPAGDPRALTFVLLANNPYRDEENR